MTDFVELLSAPFAACLLIAALHCYMGLHVIKRGVIFVDLALAQMAALGAAVALLLGPALGIHLHEHETAPSFHHEMESQGGSAVVVEHPDLHTSQGHHETHAHENNHPEGDGTTLAKWLEGRFGYILSLLFAFIGAVLFSLARFRDERVPHEAIIGIVFVVSSALAVLVLSKAPHGHQKMEAMLVGSILFVNWTDVMTMLLIYLPLGILHVSIRRVLMRISEDIGKAESEGIRVRFWDLIFYASFGLMVTESVSVAGVLVVFSYLIIPAACAVMFADRFFRSLLMAWGIALGVSLLGLAFSAWRDLPTGSSLVVTFGVVLTICAGIRLLLVRRGLLGSPETTAER